MKKIGFLSFGHWTPDPHSQTQSAADALLQSIDLAVEAERLGIDGAYFRNGAPLLGAARAALGRRAMGRGANPDLQALVERRRRRNQNRRIGWLRPDAPGLSRTSSRVAKRNAAREGNGLCISVDDRQGKETALRFQLRR